MEKSPNNLLDLDLISCSNLGVTFVGTGQVKAYIYMYIYIYIPLAHGY